MNIPQLIVFEGVDAVGKSSVSAAFARAITDRGVAAKLLSFPGKEAGTLGQLVYQLHHDHRAKDVEQLTSVSLQALHIAAHLDAIERTIIPALEQGQTIVLDRYWWSTWVYGIIDGAPPDILSALIEVERLAWGRWKPGLVFHVERLSPLRDEPEDRWQRLADEYRVLARREAKQYPIKVLNNDGNLGETLETAVASVYGC